MPDDYCSICGRRDGRHWAGCPGVVQHPSIVPCDWDHESYCTIDGCTRPATHTEIIGIRDNDADDPIMEAMLCCVHAHRP